MKLTDFALIFIGVTLPIMIIVYVNVSFTIKAEEQEIYYKKVINAALNDASNQMKEVENADAEIDYGYSGNENSKISVNAQVAVDTFLNSLYNNFGIKGNKVAENYLQYFIPAIAIIDYNGVQVSSIEEYTKGGQNVIEHVVKPKKYYTYTYYIYKDTINNKLDFTDDIDVANNSLISTHIIEFTMDDYITHRGFTKTNSGEDVDIPVSSFYISDTENNAVLAISSLSSSINIPNSVNSLTNQEKQLLDVSSEKNLIKLIETKRKEVIIKSIQDEMEYATNNNNFYASNAGIKYNFIFPVLEEAEMESQIKNVGIMALVQGISMGNRYLNVRAYSTSKLTEITRYYLSIPSNKSEYKANLYHKDKECSEYLNADHEYITPQYLFTRQQAASVNAVKKEGNSRYITLQGFYPCPICNP